MRKPRVWIEGSLVAEAKERLSASAEIVDSRNTDDIVGAAAAVLGPQLPADDALIEKAGEGLLVFARPGIGVDNIDIEAATRHAVLVINTPDAPTESTAEHTVALLLSLTKRVVRAHISLTGTGVPQDALLGTEVAGRTLGVVGYGRIGSRVAEICGAGLRMKVLVYDPYVPATAIRPAARKVETLEEILTGSDVVTLHTALYEATRHLIGERELRLMKPGAYLINASRGPVVDETALVDALRERRVAGAALDVFETEPPLSDNPLFGLDNVVVTPHIASFTDLGTKAMGLGVVEQLEQIFRGERPHNLLNPEAWPGRIGAGGRA